MWGSPGSDDLLRTMRLRPSAQSDELLEADDDEADPGDAWKNPWPSPSPEDESSDRPRRSATLTAQPAGAGPPIRRSARHGR